MLSKKIKNITSFVVAFIMGMVLLSSVNYTQTTVYAGELPTVTSSTGVTNLVSTSDGFNRIYADDDAVHIEKYDDDLNILSKFQLEKELDIYAGFYEGKDAYYLVFGQNNKEEDTAKEIIRVVKYSKDWKRIGAAKLTGDSEFAHETRFPFDLGYPEMAEYNGILYLVMGHEGYVDPQYNQGHQGKLMYAVDEKKLTGYIFDADLWHSFQQDIAVANSDEIYVLEQSEGSAYAKLTKYNENYGTADYWKQRDMYKSIKLLQYGGKRTSAWAVATFATTDGVAVSDKNVLTIGTSIDQSKYDTDERFYNVYLTVTPRNNFSEEATTFKWLTTDGTSSRIDSPTMLKINDNRFLIMYGINKNDMPGTINTFRYVFVDGNGNVIGNEFLYEGKRLNVRPVLKGDKAIFYYAGNGECTFYSLNVNTGEIKSKRYRIAGKNAEYEINGEELVIKGSGSIDAEFSSSLNYSEKNAIKRVIINSGISEIKTRALSGLSNLEEVTLADGVVTIGDKAFVGDRSLKNIRIPRSVTNIALDAFTTGSYWVGSGEPVKIKVTINGYEDSYVQNYASENGFKFKPIEIRNGWVNVDGVDYWYENDIKQGLEGRGKEIYDPSTDEWYWLDAVQNGAVARSKDVYQESKADDNGTIGKWVRYDANGHMVKGWDNNANGAYYFDPVYGTMYKGAHTIDGVDYVFDEVFGTMKSCSISLSNHWEKINGVEYWYENGQRQGRDVVHKNYRGKEIYDPGSNAWYWLDNVDAGKKAVSKDVYQESLAGDWGDMEKTDDDGNVYKCGKWVRYDANGHMIKGWSVGYGEGARAVSYEEAMNARNENQPVYYFDWIYGTMAKGNVVIDGVEYDFDQMTGVMN